MICNRWPAKVPCPGAHPPDAQIIVSPRYDTPCCRFCLNRGKRPAAEQVMREKYGPPRGGAQP